MWFTRTTTTPSPDCSAAATEPIGFIVFVIIIIMPNFMSCCPLGLSGTGCCSSRWGRTCGCRSSFRSQKGRLSTVVDFIIMVVIFIRFILILLLFCSLLLLTVIRYYLGREGRISCSVLGSARSALLCDFVFYLNNSLFRLPLPLEFLWCFIFFHLCFPCLWRSRSTVFATFIQVFCC